MHRIFYFLEILDIVIKTVFLDVFQDDVNYSSLTKKKKAVILMIDSLLFINKKDFKFCTFFHLLIGSIVFFPKEKDAINFADFR